MSLKHISQSATWTPFRAPIPVISHCVKFGFNLRKYKKNGTCQTCFIKMVSFKKKVVPSGYAE